MSIKNYLEWKTDGEEAIRCFADGKSWFRNSAPDTVAYGYFDKDGKLIAVEQGLVPKPYGDSKAVPLYKDFWSIKHE